MHQVQDKPGNNIVYHSKYRKYHPVAPQILRVWAVNGQPKDSICQYALYSVLAELQNLYLRHLHICHLLDGETVFDALTPKLVKPLPLHKP